MRISDWSSDVCSSDLPVPAPIREPDCRSAHPNRQGPHWHAMCVYSPARAVVARLPQDRSSWGHKAREVQTTPWGYTMKNNQQRSEEHKSELQSPMRHSYAVFRSKKQNKKNNKQIHKDTT